MQRHWIPHIVQALVKIGHWWNGIIGWAAHDFCTFRGLSESHVPFFFQGFFNRFIAFFADISLYQLVCIDEPHRLQRQCPDKS
ncbi:unknown [Bacteroides sp. CAG:702]|nr:unknown [Bacteroides sp. CAG:702]